jgi:hypothetical protein
VRHQTVEEKDNAYFCIRCADNKNGCAEKENNRANFSCDCAENENDCANCLIWYADN